jgi:ATP-independent RNA helicase DbpA
VIEAGKKDKIRPGDILGALTGECGIQNKDIGKIDVYATQTYVAIHRNVVHEAQRKLAKGKIKKRKFSVWFLSEK